MAITLKHDYQAAALSRAAAIRALHAYRSARDRATQRGADLALLIDPPPFGELDRAYGAVIEDVIDQRIESPSVARSAIDLLAAIMTDEQLGEIVGECGPASIEKDQADRLRLLAGLSGWVNKVDIEEAIEEERAKFAPSQRQPSGVDQAELRRRAEAIVAEFGQIPEPTDEGILEAERRVNGLRAAHRALAKEVPYGIEDEEIINETIIAVEIALVEFIHTTPAEGAKAAAAKLREVMVAEAPTEDVALQQVLAVLEREAQQ